MGKESKKNPVAQMTGDEAKDFLVKEQAKNVELCKKEVMAVCEKYKCTINVAMLIKQGMTKAIIEIVPKQGD